MLALACTPDKGETSASGGSTGASGGGSSGEATGATSEPGTSGAASTGGGGSATGGETTGGVTTEPATTGPMTTEPGTTGPGTSGPMTTGPMTTGGSETTGGEPGECAGNDDCKLFSDCCACDGVPLEDMTPACMMECKQPKCSEYGVEQAECRFGVCRAARLTCDGNKVVCDALPPPCPDGFLAETSPACWTGKCVPAALCDAVPDCALCPDGTVCVQDIAFGPQGWPRCEPIPAACGGKASCGCMGDLVCTGDFKACSPGDTGLNCECLNC